MTRQGAGDPGRPCRAVQPSEIAATAMFLASDHARFYVGQTLYPNGGALML